jgi:hypothetical protein
VAGADLLDSVVGVGLVALAGGDLAQVGQEGDGLVVGVGLGDPDEGVDALPGVVALGCQGVQVTGTGCCGAPLLGCSPGRALCGGEPLSFGASSLAPRPQARSPARHGPGRDHPLASTVPRPGGGAPTRTSAQQVADFASEVHGDLDLDLAIGKTLDVEAERQAEAEAESNQDAGVDQAPVV